MYISNVGVDQIIKSFYYCIYNNNHKTTVGALKFHPTITSKFNSAMTAYLVSYIREDTVKNLFGVQWLSVSK